jgi:hypothetical protein
MLSLLSSRDRESTLPPLAFLLTAYFVATTTGALTESVLGDSWEGFGYSVVFHALGEQVGTIEVDPVKLVLLALPVILALLAVSFVSATLTRTDRRTVTALFAYTTGFVWTTVAALLLLGLIIAPIAWTLNAFGITLLMFAFWVGPMFLGVAIIAAIVWIARSTSWCAREKKRRIWRFTSGVVLALGAVAACTAETTLAVQALGQKLTPHPSDVAIEVSTLSLGAPDSAWDVRSSTAPFTRVFATPAVVDSAAAPIPLDLVVVVANHSDSTLLLDRRRGTLQIGVRNRSRPVRDATAGLSCGQDVPLQVTTWSDGEAPVLVVGKGETKWIRFGGQLRGFRTAAQLGRFSFTLAVQGLSEGRQFQSPWYNIEADDPPSDPCAADRG